MRIIREMRDFFLSLGTAGIITTLAIYTKIFRIYFPLFKKPLHYITKWNASMMLKEVFLSKDYYFKAPQHTPLTIIDGGGNIGVSTLFFKKQYPQSEIMVFEPDAITRETLEKNVGRLDKVTIYPYGLSGKNEKMDFFHNAVNPGGSSLYPKEGHQFDKDRMTVECRKLSDFITTAVFILKLDIEGAELSVLEDLDHSGKLSLVEHIAMEYHYNLSNNALSKILSILESNNFTVGFGTSIFDRRQFYYSSYILRASKNSELL